MSNNISVETVAKRMGVTPMFLRMGMRQGKIPFGIGVQMPGGRWRYYINERKVEEYLGKDK